MQIEEAQDEAERPHADHIRGPEVAYQLTGGADIHAHGFSGVFRHPGDKAQLAQDIAERGDREQQYAHAPFLFGDRLRVMLFFAQNREFNGQRQQENRQINDANADINPVPRQMARQQHAGNHRENRTGHAEEGVGKQQTRSALTTFINMGDQEGADRHGNAAYYAQHEHTDREHRQAVAGHQAQHRQQHQHEAEDQLTLQRHDLHQPGIKEYRNQDTGIEEGEGIAHFRNRKLEIVSDIA